MGHGSSVGFDSLEQEYLSRSQTGMPDDELLPALIQKVEQDHPGVTQRLAQVLSEKGLALPSPDKELAGQQKGEAAAMDGHLQFPSLEQRQSGQSTSTPSQSNKKSAARPRSSNSWASGPEDGFQNTPKLASSHQPKRYHGNSTPSRHPQNEKPRSKSDGHRTIPFTRKRRDIKVLSLTVPPRKTLGTQSSINDHVKRQQQARQKKDNFYSMHYSPKTKKNSNQKRLSKTAKKKTSQSSESNTPSKLRSSQKSNSSIAAQKAILTPQQINDQAEYIEDKYVKLLSFFRDRHEASLLQTQKAEELIHEYTYKAEQIRAENLRELEKTEKRLELLSNAMAELPPSVATPLYRPHTNCFSDRSALDRYKMIIKAQKISHSPMPERNPAAVAVLLKSCSKLRVKVESESQSDATLTKRLSFSSSKSHIFTVKGGPNLEEQPSIQEDNTLGNDVMDGDKSNHEGELSAGNLASKNEGKRKCQNASDTGMSVSDYNSDPDDERGSAKPTEAQSFEERDGNLPASIATVQFAPSKDQMKGQARVLSSNQATSKRSSLDLSSRSEVYYMDEFDDDLGGSKMVFKEPILFQNEKSNSATPSSDASFELAETKTSVKEVSEELCSKDPSSKRKISNQTQQTKRSEYEKISSLDSSGDTFPTEQSPQQLDVEEHHRILDLHFDSNEVFSEALLERAIRLHLDGKPQSPEASSWSLRVDNKSLKDDDARAIAQCCKNINLHTLSLQNNTISNDGAVALAKLSGLTNLNLQNNTISNDGAVALAKLSGLTNLNLEGNLLEDEGASALLRCSTLATLNLKNNRISEVSKTSLASNNRIKIILEQENDAVPAS